MQSSSLLILPNKTAGMGGSKKTQPQSPGATGTRVEECFACSVYHMPLLDRIKEVLNCAGLHMHECAQSSSTASPPSACHCLCVRSCSSCSSNLLYHSLSTKQTVVWLWLLAWLEIHVDWSGLACKQPTQESLAFSCYMLHCCTRLS